ncbi:hypothetical protein BGE01nite_44030 [Brevifollis gellanilyticus]|uniref:Uncharacterized protein n=1 Tax=Brevifollis gellanilyticus TaxID=748831 RepID=A0A512MEI7_9BACT|nr:hypothetical protein BGE01nite_44030 [Brevifollis gellanilyticus]
MPKKSELMGKAQTSANAICPERHRSETVGSILLKGHRNQPSTIANNGKRIPRAWICFDEPGFARSTFVKRAFLQPGPNAAKQSRV